MRNKILIILIISVFFVLGSVISRISTLSKPRSTSSYTVTAFRSKDIIRNDREFLGDPSAIWTLVEFGDYQCPGCIRSHNAIKSLISTKINVRYQFRHYPLTNIHDFAEFASLLSIEAETRKIYPSVHEDLFALKGNLSKETILKLCKKHNIKNINKTKNEKLLYIDLESVKKLDIDSTPTFFLCTPNNNVLKIRNIQSINNIVRNSKL